MLRRLAGKAVYLVQAGLERPNQFRRAAFVLVEVVSSGLFAFAFTYL
jgi:hypothetical protein